MNTNQRSTAEQVLVAFGAVLLGIVAATVLLWSRFHTQIAEIVMATQHAQLMLLALVSQAYRVLDSDVMRADPSMVRPKSLWVLCSQVGQSTRYPFCAALLGLAVLCFRRASSGRFTRRFDINSLSATLAETFPVSKAYLGRGLKLVSPAEGLPRPLDPQLHPQEWIDRFAVGADGTFDEGATFAALREQLGAPWTGLHAAAAHVQCLAVAFWLHGRTERAEALRVVAGLALATQGLAIGGPAGPDGQITLPKPFSAQIRVYMAEQKGLRAVDEGAARHAYTATVLMSLLTQARRDAGVFNPGLFVALKLVDRPLWYALQALGFPQEQGPIWEAMPAPCIEAAGAIEHWREECVAGKAIAIPEFTSSFARIRALIGKDDAS